MRGTYSSHGKMRNAHKVLVRKYEGKRLLWRFCYGLEGSIKTELGI